MSMPVGRLDICSVEPFAAAQIMVPNATTDALTWARADMIVSRVKTAPKAARPNMPPPPAAPLSDYDVEVLTKWVAQVKATTATPGELHPACRKQVRNRDPQAKRVGKAEVVDGSLSVTIDVSDIDGDQVLGKISAGSGDAQPIPGTGRRTFQFAGASADTKLNLVLHDGYSQVDLEL